MESRQPFPRRRNDEDQAATQEGEAATQEDQVAAQEDQVATQEDQVTTQKDKAATQDIQEVCYCIICTTVIFKLKYNIKQITNCFLFNFYTFLI